MFSALADDDDEPQQQQKTVQKKPQTAQPKKVEQQPRPQTAVKAPRAEDLGDFEGVTGQETRQRGGFRGGRGGNRGGRGGARGGRGERREGEEGRSPPRGGFRGGRGGRGGRGERREGEEGGAFENRGDFQDRPRGRGRGRGRGRPQGEEGAALEGGDEGVLYVQRKEKVDHTGKDEHFKGKKSEQWHPYDRRSGTGRGRDVVKGGHGKGNIGKAEDDVKYNEDTTPAEENKTETVQIDAGVEEGTEQAQLEGSPEVRRQRDEPVEEEEEKGQTLQDFLAKRKTAGIKKEARAVEAVTKANIEKVEKVSDRTGQINSQLKGRDVYATGRQEGADLLGFQGGDDEFVREERSGRGGRRGGRGGARGGARGGNQGGQRRGGAMKASEEEFPTLG